MLQAMTSTRAQLSAASPFPLRLWAYLQERFPPLGHGVLITSYYSSNQFLAHVLTHPGQQVAYSTRSLMGAAAVLCVFFHLRVFDEHKDFDEDRRHHPDRVLQRGLITLDHLKALGAAAIAVELLMGYLLGWPALVAVLAVIAFSCLMLKEFFIGGWLRRHFLLYAVSHMLIMPLLAMVVYSAATNRHFWYAPAWFWLYAWVGFFVTFNWEISRKIRSPEQEVDGLDSYTKVFGTYGAAYAVLIVRVVDTAMVSLVGYRLGLSPWFYVVLVALFLLCLTGFFHYRFNTNPRTAKRMETYAGMYIIAFDLTLAVEIARTYGIEWPF